MLIPIYLRSAKKVARSKKLIKMPIIVKQKLRLTLLGRVAPNFVREKILIAKTGKTQGIKLRIKPPKIARMINFKFIVWGSCNFVSILGAPCRK